MFTTLSRIFTAGIKGFYRNFTISISAILVIVISLLSFASIYLALEMIKPSVAQLEQKVDINLYFEPDAVEEDILALKGELESITQVETVEYITRDQALINFRERQNSDVIVDALESLGENPLGAAFNIRAEQISQYGQIAAFLESEATEEKYGEAIEEVNYNQNKGAIDKLNVIIGSVEKFGIVVSSILAIIAIVITYNTIRVTIYTARNEVRVMRLVGASKFFARGPFIIEGLFYGLIAGLLAVLVLAIGLYYAAPPLQEIFILNIFDFFASEVIKISLALIGIGMVLGAISSILAIRRYLNI